VQPGVRHLPCQSSGRRDPASGPRGSARRSCTPDRARHAVASARTRSRVSTHGGNNIDGTPASIPGVTAVVDAVGGPRRGPPRRRDPPRHDIVKALAIGARAVLIGRANSGGWAANGGGRCQQRAGDLRRGIDEPRFGPGAPPSTTSPARRDRPGLGKRAPPHEPPAGPGHVARRRARTMRNAVLAVPIGSNEQHGHHHRQSTDHRHRRRASRRARVTNERPG